MTAALVPAMARAASITGTVTNRTTNKVSAGDDVVLIRLAQGMQEAARTTTDARGHYSIEVPDSQLHLIRVTHDKANYFQPAPPGTTTVNVDVFNATAHVKGVTGEADVQRLQTDESGKTLRVVENFFVKNDSTPPMTQFSDRPFEFYLPAGAVVEGSAALSPGGMPVQASPVPLGDDGHYAFIFPIRPGETRFQITYHLPYTGNVTLSPRPMMTTDTVALMMPKSMHFEAKPSAPYTAVNDEVNAQTFVARNVQPSQVLGYTLSGTGQLPRDTAATNTAAGQGGDAGQAAGGGGSDAGGAADAGGTPDRTKFGGGLGNPVDPSATNDPWAKYRWWILGGLGLALAAGAGVLLKQPAAGAAGLAQGPGRVGAGGLGAPGAAVPYEGGGFGAAKATDLMAVLKEELFLLEADRLRGRVTEAEYREVKPALEIVLRRALEREEPEGFRAAGGTDAAVGDVATAERR